MNLLFLLSPDRALGFKPFFFGKMYPQQAPLKIFAVPKKSWHLTAVALR
ncbi:hypothetical protein [Microcoleus sp. herbarium12]|jgi:hypothetical protein